MKKLPLISLFIAACASHPVAEKSLVDKPLVIAHRGWPGHLPEHTLEGYERAIDLGADFVEPDLVSTKDGVLVVRHENEISGTTDVARKFPKRKTTKVVDGQAVTGWFVEDFTLAEVKALRANERVVSRSQANNGKFRVPSFEDVLKLIERKSREKKRVIGVYPETKHPSYFRALGLELEPKLVAALERHDLNRAGAPVFVQSFEPSSLQKLRGSLRVRMIQLLDEEKVQPYDFVLAKDPRTYGDLMLDGGLAFVSSYANGIGPWKQSIVVNPRKTTDLVGRAHRHGLLVHPYTFRGDREFLPAQYEGDPEREYREFFDLGVDGVFSDFAEQALAARARWLRGK